MQKNKSACQEELRLLHMAITAVRRNINMQLDGLLVRIEWLLPQRKTRNLTAKEMKERMDRIMTL